MAFVSCDENEELPKPKISCQSSYIIHAKNYNIERPCKLGFVDNCWSECVDGEQYKEFEYWAKYFYKKYSSKYEGFYDYVCVEYEDFSYRIDDGDGSFHFNDEAKFLYYGDFECYYKRNKTAHQ